MKRVIFSLFITVSMWAHEDNIHFQSTSHDQLEYFDVCKEFLQEQERNVQDLLIGYKAIEKRNYNILHDGVKKELQEKYKRELQEYESNKKSWVVKIFSTPPIKPTEEIVQAEVQKLIERAYTKRNYEHGKTLKEKLSKEPLSEEDILVALRLRMHYYEKIYPSVKEYLRTLTEEQIKEIFTTTRFGWIRPDRSTKGVSLLHVSDDFNCQEAFYYGNENYLFDYNLVSPQDDHCILSDLGHPIALVFRGNGLQGQSTWQSKVKYYFSQKH